MAASFIQVVTLFAFIAHAVLGCCWHHAHAVAGCTSKAVAESHSAACPTAAVAEHCGGGSTERAKSHCSHQQQVAKSCEGARSSSDRLVDSECCRSSHQPSHHCTSIRCTYISAKLLSLDLATADALEGFVNVGDLRRQLLAAHGNGRVGCRPPLSFPQSSVELCVHLQTWQI